MDLPSILFYIAVAAVSVFIIYSSYKDHQRLQVSWSTLAEQLGLQLEDTANGLTGEHTGIAVQLHLENRRVGGSGRNFLVVRAKIPYGLPRGFVAAARKWESWIDQKFADNLIPSGHPEVDKLYVFQCDQPELGKLLVEDANVQQALAALASPLRVAYVRNNHVHVAYRNFRDDVEEAQSALDAVTDAARTLSRVRLP